MVNKSVTNTYHLSYVTTHELNSFLGNHPKKTELYKMRDFTSFNDISWATCNAKQRCEDVEGMEAFAFARFANLS